MAVSEQVVEVTEAVAEYACAEVAADERSAAVEVALKTLVDTVGVAVGARRDPACRISRTLGPDVGVGPAAMVWYDGSRTDPCSAALLNGIAAHALDFDLGGMFQGHPASVIWPAVLAGGEVVAASGREIVDAAIVGYNVCAAIAAGMDMRAHFKDWHATSTISAFGAAVAAGRVLGLDVDQMRMALGITGSLVSGSRQNFGTMTKPLHAGMAARDGLLAATLAAKGFTADPSELEAPLGFYAVYGSGLQLDHVIATLAGPMPLLALGVGIKRYPCCYSSHRSIVAALSLRPELTQPIEQIGRIAVTIEPRGLEAVIQHHPQTADEGRFSLEYAVVAALLDGSASLESFTDEAVRRPVAQLLISHSAVRESTVPPAGPPTWEGRFYSVVEVTDKAGVHTARVDDFQDRAAALSRAEIDAKFQDCVAFAGWPALDSTELLQELWPLDDVVRFAGFSALQART